LTESINWAFQDRGTDSACDESGYTTPLETPAIRCPQATGNIGFNLLNDSELTVTVVILWVVMAKSIGYNFAVWSLISVGKLLLNVTRPSPMTCARDSPIIA